MSTRGIGIVILIALGWPATAGPVPDLASFRERLRQTEALAERARHVGSVSMRMQNMLTEQIYSRTLSCNPETSSLLARQRHLGHVYRDLLQAWRVEARILEEQRQSPTVAPLVREDDQARLESLLVDLNRELRLWSSLSGWQRSRIEPWAGVCSAALVPDEGLPPWSPHDPFRDKTLVIGAGPGRLCPDNVSAEGTVLLVDGEACYGGTTCDCLPQPVLSGAVLGEGS